MDAWGGSWGNSWGTSWERVVVEYALLHPPFSVLLLSGETFLITDPGQTSVNAESGDTFISLEG